MPTLDELAARLTAVEQRLGIGPTPAPTPAPTGKPAKPTGLKCVIGADGRPDLRWDSAAGVTAWEVHDLANPGKTLQATVTEPRTIRAAVKPGQRRRYAVLAVGPGGRSGMSDPIDVPPGPATPEPGPPPGTGTSDVPGAVLDLSHWYLTLPVAPPAGDEDTSGPWDIYQPRLATFSHELFHTGSDDHGLYVEYIAPVSGPGVTTTSNASGAARCELREMTGPDRSDKAAWSFNDGKRHALTVTLTCDATSITGDGGRQECIVGQIHSAGGSPPLILSAHHGRKALEVYRQGPRQGDLLTGLQPGEVFTYRIEAQDGRLRLYACKGTVDQLPTAPAFDWPASVLTEQTGEYFKAGAYNKTPISAKASGRAIVRHYFCEVI